MQITENCLVKNMPEDVYHGDPTPVLDGYVDSASLSSSTAVDIIEKTEIEAKLGNRRLSGKTERNEGSEATDMGDIAHAYVLRNGQKVYEVANVDAWRSADAKAQKAHIESRGLIALNTTTAPRFVDTVKGMHAALHEQLAKHEDFPGLMMKGVGEQSGFAKDGNIWLRARFDWLDENYPDIVVDYKTTGKSFDSWDRDLWGDGRQMQNPHYRKVLSLINKRPITKFLWVVQQTFEPYLVRVIQIDKSVMDEVEARYKIARERFENCLKTGIWRGELPRTFHSAPPPWVLNRWEADEMNHKIVKQMQQQSTADEVRMAG